MKKKNVIVCGIFAVSLALSFIACDDEGSNNTVDKNHTHAYGTWVQKTPATCTAAEVEKRTCSCGGEETRDSTTNLALGHAGLTGEVEATCTTEGNTGGGTCTRCHLGIAMETIPTNNNHDWEILTGTASTCTTNGEGKEKCKRCGKEEEGDSLDLDPYNHTWGDYIQTTPPTCVEKGIKTKKCNECHVVSNETEDGDAIDPNTHEWNFTEEEHWDETLIPNCTEKGKEQRTCELCDEKEERELSKDLDEHDIEVVTGKAPTCFTDGHGTIRCKREGCDYSVTGDTIPAPGHHHFVEHWEVYEAATCTATGIDERFCTHNCSEEGNRETRISEIDHNNHDFSLWQTTNAANCTTTLMETEKCSRCSTLGTVTKTGTIDANVHTFTQWQETTAPTCAATAIETEECSGCSVLGTRTRTGRAALGHNWVIEEVIAPTCTETGYAKQICSVCNNPNTTSVTIAMWDSNGNGWNSIGALRININGTDLSPNVGLASGSTGTSTFSVSMDDEVKIYWVWGRFGQEENAFAVYYSDDPPSPQFFPSSSNWSPSYDPNGKVLVYRQYNTMDNIPDGTLLGSFTAKDGNIIPALGHDCEWSAYNSSNGHVSCNRNGCDGGLAKIGDTGPAGGKIIYVKPEGFTVTGYTGTIGSFASYTAHYIEAAPASEGGAEWGDSVNVMANVTTFTNTSDSRASLIGNGRRDTQIIVNRLRTIGETGKAAQLCTSKTVTVGGTVYNDWFLPSLGELNEMYKANLGITSRYWSSSQVTDWFAWVQSFDDGSRSMNNKFAGFNVHAVRAF